MTTDFQFLNSTGDGALAIDESRRIIYWNEAATRLLGYAANEVVGQRCYQIFGDLSSRCTPWLCYHCDAIRLSQPTAIATFQATARHRDGYKLVLDISTLIDSPSPKNPTGTTIIHLFRPVITEFAPTKRLRIQLLGNVCIWRSNGSPVQGTLWQQAKVRALLALLAVRRGQPIFREIIMEFLWPELDIDSAQHNLHTAVHNLRRSLEPNLQRVSKSAYILFNNGGYLLNEGENHWLDVVAFETAVKQARETTNPAEAISYYQQAVELYGDDFLLNLNHTISWHLDEQERLRELLLDIVEEMGQLYEQVGNDKAARTTYLQALAKDPCRESACYRLMQLAWRQGNRTAAIAQYQHLRARLKHELGVSPSEETQKLYQRIKATP